MQLTPQEQEVLQAYSELTDSEALALSEEEQREYAELLEKSEEPEVNVGLKPSDFKEGALPQLVKGAGAAILGASAGYALELPRSGILSDRVKNFYEQTEKDYPAWYGGGNLIGSGLNPAGKLLGAPKYVGKAWPIIKDIGSRAALAGAETGVADAMLGKSASQIAEDVENSAMFGGAFATARRAGNLLFDFGKEMSPGIGRDVKKVFGLSKKHKETMQDPDSSKIADEIADNYYETYNNLKKFIAKKKGDVGDELKVRENELENITTHMVDSKKIPIKVTFNNLVNNYINKVKNSRKTLVYELSKDKTKAVEFLKRVKLSAIYKDPDVAQAYQEAIDNGVEKYSDEMMEIIEDTMTKKGISKNVNRGWGKPSGNFPQLEGRDKFPTKRINNTIRNDDLAKGESKIQVHAELSDINSAFNDFFDDMNAKYVDKDLTLRDLLNFKRDMYDFLNYDKIKIPSAGVDISLDSTKQFKFREIDKVLHGLTADVKNLVHNIDKEIPVPAGVKRKNIVDMDDEYHALSKLEETTPNASAIQGITTDAKLTESERKAREYGRLLAKGYPEEARRFTNNIKKSMYLGELYRRTGDRAGSLSVAPGGIIARAIGETPILRSSSILGKWAGQFEENYPKTTATTKFGAGVLDAITGKEPGIALARKLVEKYPEAGQKTQDFLFGSEFQPMSYIKEKAQDVFNTIIPEGQAQEIPMAPNIPPVSQMPAPLLAPELAQGLRMERSYTAAVRNKDILLPNLYSIDPAAGKTFENALASQDTKAVENMMSMFTQMPEYENVFQPSPVKTSKGDAKSAVVVPGNKARIVNPMEVSTMTSDIKYNDALSERDKMLQIDQLHRSSTINLN